MTIDINKVSLQFGLKVNLKYYYRERKKKGRKERKEKQKQREFVVFYLVLWQLVYLSIKWL